jgi:hypothetical protein
MSDKVLEYAVYDVLYLVSLYEKIITISPNLIPEITRNIFFYKRIENNYFKQINNIVNEYNNSYIKINNENIKLVDFYYFVIYNLNNKIYLQVLDITYYKFFIEIIYKYLIYTNISLKYKIYNAPKIKNNLIDKIIFGDSIINFFKDLVKEIKLFI